MPREKTSVARTVYQSTPYAPPPPAPAEHSRHWNRSLAAVAVALIVAGWTWYVWPPGSSSTTTAATPIAPSSGTLQPQEKVASTSVPSIETSVPTYDDGGPGSTRRIRPVDPKIRLIKAPHLTDALPRFDPVATNEAKSFTTAVSAEEVQKAIDRGIEYLRKNKPRWLDRDDHGLGYASLGGLALLEAGVAPDDELVQETARRIRRTALRNFETYDISLAILFFDRLGDAQDEATIRSLALRLIAGQTVLWGWDYKASRLSTDLEPPLISLLEKLRPVPSWQIPLRRDPGKGLIELPMPLAGNSALEAPRAVAAGASIKPPSREPGLVMPLMLDQNERQKLVKELPGPLQSLPLLTVPLDVAKKEPGLMPPLRKGPRFAMPGFGPPIFGKGRPDRDDNSNTQFALLALWAARRHGMPTEAPLVMGDQRFARSQLNDGTWGYRVWEPHGRPAMTCVGLLGLAMGHGALLPTENDRSPASPRAATDPAIQKGLQALGQWIGDPSVNTNVPAPNLYFLWSVERVAMLGGKDWYGWGAKFLVKNQTPDGGWRVGGYPGSESPVDTSLALLFLRRSNLVRDLTQRLRLHMAITDPDHKTP